jgi:hypothetical protein
MTRPITPADINRANREAFAKSRTGHGRANKPGKMRTAKEVVEWFAPVGKRGQVPAESMVAELVNLVNSPRQYDLRRNPPADTDAVDASSELGAALAAVARLLPRVPRRHS